MKMKSTFASLLVAICLLSFTGCKQEADSAGATRSANSADDHGHEYANSEEHDHSVAGHGHGAGPHDGTIADWGGGKFHVEFTVDHGETQATVYVLGGDETTPTPIEADSIELSIVDPEMLVTLKAAPQDHDPEGKASRFIGTHEKLDVVQEYEGTITGVIDGTPYSGDFKEEAHDHE